MHRRLAPRILKGAQYVHPLCRFQESGGFDGKEAFYVHKIPHLSSKYEKKKLNFVNFRFGRKTSYNESAREKTPDVPRKGAGAFAVLGDFLRKKEAGIHAMSGKSRLAEALVDWMNQAEERGVYLEYRFSGPRPCFCEADGKLLGEIGSVVSAMLGGLRKAAGSGALDEPGAGPGHGGPASILRGFGKL